MLRPCFVFQEKTDVKPIIPPALEEGRDTNHMAANIGIVQDRLVVHNIDAEFKLKFGLVEAVHYKSTKGMVCVQPFPNTYVTHKIISNHILSQ